MKLSRRSLLRGTAAALAAPALGALVAAMRRAQRRRGRSRGAQLEARPVAVRRAALSGKASSISTTSTRPRRRAARCAQIAFGTFDNFNSVVAGVKGSLASGLELISESLTTPALDEVSTEYGLLAEAVSYPDGPHLGHLPPARQCALA